MKTVEKIREEIEALKRLAADNPDDAAAQVSIEGQIDALLWASDYEAELVAA
jgi:hypothetical protein